MSYDLGTYLLQVVTSHDFFRASKNKSATETKIPIKKQKTKEKNGEISNASGRTTAKKRSADKPLKEVQLENMEFSGRVGVNGIARETPLATNENVLLSKIPKSAQKTDISENNNEFLQSSQTRSLRSWLRTSVSNLFYVIHLTLQFLYGSSSMGKSDCSVSNYEAFGMSVSCRN